MEIVILDFFNLPLHSLWWWNIPKFQFHINLKRHSISKETVGYSSRTLYWILTELGYFSTWSSPTFMHLSHRFCSSFLIPLAINSFGWSRGHFCIASLSSSLLAIFFHIRRFESSKQIKIRRGKVWTVKKMRQDLPIRFLKLIASQLVHMGASVIVLLNDPFFKTPRRLLLLAFNCVLQHLGILMATDSSLIFEEIAED